MASTCHFGAIRWDAWYADTGPAVSTRRSLGPTQYQDRAPFFSTILSTNDIAYAPTEATMTQEINAAVAGGLSYWAFLLYDRAYADKDMMAGYDLFQANPNKSLMKWCQIRNTDMWGSTGNYATQVAEALAMCQQTNYMKVDTTRPLVYIYGATASSNFGGSDVNFKAAIDAFRAACTGAGLGDPYIVVLGGAASAGHAAKTAWGCNAISNYISSFAYDACPSTYLKLDTDAQAFWASCAATGSETVPICMLGWDSSPRKKRPVTWAPTQRPYNYAVRNFAKATNGELVTHLTAAVDYIDANAVACPQRVALMYAWNEFDEGGWLCPTIGDPTGSRLTAIKSVIEF
jgi:hypothetical protein